MKKLFSAILASVLCMPFFTSVSCNNYDKGEEGVYYINSESGSDKNNGKSREKAWKSFKNLKDLTLHAGDTVYLSGSFDECLKFNGQGSEDKPVTFTSYGNKKALIAGTGASGAVIIKNQSNIVISNFEITNKPIINTSNAIRRCGVSIIADEGKMTNIKVLNCDIHDVEGTVLNPNMYTNAGIYIKHLKAGSEENCFDGILVDGCTLTDIKGVGIRSADGFEWSEGDTSMNVNPGALNYVFKNVVIKRTEIRRTGADGIILANCYKPLVEDVKCFDAGYWSNATTKVIAGVWACATESATYRRVEVARTKFIDGDGQAFDTDWGCTGTFTWEYCYTHDNDGGLILRHLPVDGVFRYCISVNDENPNKTFSDGDLAGTKGLIYFATINDNYNCGTMHFYNCIFYNDKAEMAVSRGAAYDSKKNNWLASQDYDPTVNEFSNCIFVSINQVKWGLRQKYSNNCYYNLKGEMVAPGQDAYAKVCNPMFVGGIPKDSNGLVIDKSNPEGFFALTEASRLIGAGRIIENNGGTDFAGNRLKDKSVSIGAFEKNKENK